MSNLGIQQFFVQMEEKLFYMFENNPQNNPFIQLNTWNIHYTWHTEQ